jgi:hypothetical protein
VAESEARVQQLAGEKAALERELSELAAARAAGDAARANLVATVGELTGDVDAVRELNETVRAAVPGVEHSFSDLLLHPWQRARLSCLTLAACLMAAEQAAGGGRGNRVAQSGQRR